MVAKQPGTTLDEILIKLENVRNLVDRLVAENDALWRVVDEAREGVNFMRAGGHAMNRWEPVERQIKILDAGRNENGRCLGTDSQSCG